MDNKPDITKFKTDDDKLTGERLEFYYVPVEQVEHWDRNPKQHDIGGIIESISKYGFRDPPAWDNEINGVVEGNGRSQALKIMQTENYPLPRGVLENKDTGEWCIPVLFGIDAESELIAEQYAIDHNNLTMAGGDFNMHDLARMWDTEQYLFVLQDFSTEASPPVTMDLTDIGTMLNLYGDLPQTEENSENTSDNNDDNFDNEGMSYTVYFENTSLHEDIKMSLQELLDENPGWAAIILGDKNE